MRINYINYHINMITYLITENLFRYYTIIFNKIITYNNIRYKVINKTNNGINSLLSQNMQNLYNIYD